MNHGEEARGLQAPGPKGANALERLSSIEARIARLRAQANAILMELEATRSPGLVAPHQLGIGPETFAGIYLKDACLEVLRRSGRIGEEWLSAAQVDYFTRLGGFRYATTDTRNSVGITLQRLGAAGIIEVRRAKGSSGNRYRAKAQASANLIPPKPELPLEVLHRRILDLAESNPGMNASRIAREMAKSGHPLLVKQVHGVLREHRLDSFSRRLRAAYRASNPASAPNRSAGPAASVPKP